VHRTLGVDNSGDLPVAEPGFRPDRGCQAHFMLHCPTEGMSDQEGRREMVENTQTGRNPANEQLAEALESLKATLTTTPASVVPFDSVSLHYDVKKPAGFAESLALELAGKSLTGLSGTLEVTISRDDNQVFALVASVQKSEAGSLASASGTLATVTVGVDADSCKQGQILWELITGTLADRITKLLNQGGIVTTQDPVVTQAGGVISVDVTVPGPSGASLELKTTLSFAVVNAAVVVTAGPVTVHVVASDLSDLFGDTGTAEAVAQPFAQILVETLLVPAVEAGLNDQISTTATGFQGADELSHRPFKLAGIVTTDRDNFIYSVCPVGSPGVSVNPTAAGKIGKALGAPKN
jgi:hypothetical protein